MIPRLLLLAFACVIVAVACRGDEDEAPIPAGPPPTGVPTDARALSEPTALGGETPAPGTDDTHVFESSECHDDVLTIVTDRARVFAELPCDRALPPEEVQRFVGVPVKLRVVPGAKLYVDSVAGTVEFTVGRVWIEPK